MFLQIILPLYLIFKKNSSLPAVIRAYPLTDFFPTCLLIFLVFASLKAATYPFIKFDEKFQPTRLLES